MATCTSPIRWRCVATCGWHTGALTTATTDGGKVSNHLFATIVTTPRCPLCGDTGAVRVASAELRAWLDTDGTMPILAAFPSLSDADHMRLATGIHWDCPAATWAGTDDGIRGEAPDAFRKD